MVSGTLICTYKLEKSKMRNYISVHFMHLLVKKKKKKILIDAKFKVFVMLVLKQTWSLKTNLGENISNIIYGEILSTL